MQQHSSSKYTDLLSFCYSIRWPMPSKYCDDGRKGPIHTSWLSNEWCQANAIAKLPWPAHSLELNPIENIWRKMKSHIIKHYNPCTIPELQAPIFGAWNDLPAQFLVDLLFKMHECMHFVINHNGGPTIW
ncbi:hypothetical protein O181_129584 [Austropuccinia psidii MF-1]|uniref:Tc1-like transposase DDE domain-containing protein n=1 Tax=Austropuccinia psidii MF-1 TaxID=1389203 RepID=A0A9Q3L273_9BASI|nr:hypothetical protein [Austropuccinia psidii MF-1]